MRFGPISVCLVGLAALLELLPLVVTLPESTDPNPKSGSAPASSPLAEPETLLEPQGSVLDVQALQVARKTPQAPFPHLEQVVDGVTRGLQSKVDDEAQQILGRLQRHHSAVTKPGK